MRHFSDTFLRKFHVWQWGNGGHLEKWEGLSKFPSYCQLNCSLVSLTNSCRSSNQYWNSVGHRHNFRARITRSWQSSQKVLLWTREIKQLLLHDRLQRETSYCDGDLLEIASTRQINFLALSKLSFRICSDQELSSRKKRYNSHVRYMLRKTM